MWRRTSVEAFREFAYEDLIPCVIFRDVHAHQAFPIGKRNTDLVDREAISLVGENGVNLVPGKSIPDFSITEPIGLTNTKSIAGDNPRNYGPAEPNRGPPRSNTPEQIEHLPISQFTAGLAAPGS